MKLIKPSSVKELSEIINCPVIGDEKLIINGLNEIHKVEQGDLIFVDHPKYYQKALNSSATAVIINDKTVKFPEGKAIIYSNNPFEEFNKLTSYFQPVELNENKIGRDSLIHENSFIHSTAVIGNHVKIGEKCIIHANVTIYDNVIIGNHVIIHANSVIGANAFYYKNNTKEYKPMHTCGRVVIDDYVEIGALSSIDRGVTGDTHIQSGSNIDNQVHIGHDTIIGKNCLFAAQVGIAGCVIIEDDVTLWGQVGVPSEIVIGKGAVVLGQSGISKNLEGGKTYFGSPASEARSKFRELAALKKLPEIIENLS